MFHNIQKYFDSNGEGLRIQGRVRMSLISDGGIAQTDNSIVWKGKRDYDSKPICSILILKCIIGVYGGDIVAVKIIWTEESFKSEERVFTQLIGNGNIPIDQFGIPRIYYQGPIKIVSGKYNCIVMTLFDGTLENYYQIHKSSDSPGKLPDSSILEIFRQTVCIGILFDHNIFLNHLFVLFAGQHIEIYE